MAARYELRLKNATGTVIAILDDWRSMQYSHRVNSPGQLTFAMNGNDSRAALFNVDKQVELWREDPVNGIALYLEWEGVVVTTTDATDGIGSRTLTVYGTGYLDFAARRIIAWTAGSTGANKTGTASTVMRAYVYDNLGLGATVAAGRLAAGTITGLNIGADPVSGGTWTGSRPYKNLLDVLQEIADDSGVDFDIIGTGPAVFDFMAYAGQRGTDRTVTGLDISTGENASGNVPVVFALDYGNMAVPSYSIARDGSINRVYALGQGTAATRSVYIANNASDQIAGPFNLREAARNAVSETTTAGLAYVASTAMQKQRARESFAFGVLQVPSTLYGRDYTWGDRVTARYGSVERNKRIVGVAVTVDQRESITAEIADVP